MRMLDRGYRCSTDIYSRNGVKFRFPIAITIVIPFDLFHHFICLVLIHLHLVVLVGASVYKKTRYKFQVRQFERNLCAGRCIHCEPVPCLLPSGRGTLIVNRISPLLVDFLTLVVTIVQNVPLQPCLPVPARRHGFLHK